MFVRMWMFDQDCRLYWWKRRNRWRRNQSSVAVTKHRRVLPMFGFVCVGRYCLSTNSLESVLQMRHSVRLNYFLLYFIWLRSWRSQSVAVSLDGDLPFCEPSKGLPWTKAPSRHVANGLTKHDKHPLMPCSTLHPVEAFVWPKAVGLDRFGDFPLD